MSTDTEHGHVNHGSLRLASHKAEVEELRPKLPRQFVNFYLGSQNVRALNGLQTPVKDGDVVSIIPAVAGGTDHESQGPQAG